MNIKEIIDLALERVQWNLRVTAIGLLFEDRDLGERFVEDYYWKAGADGR